MILLWAQLSGPDCIHVATPQEVSVSGQDVVYKDIIEPLESVSVSIAPSDKDDITLYGEPVDVRLSYMASLPLSVDPMYGVRQSGTRHRTRTTSRSVARPPT